MSIVLYLISMGFGLLAMRRLPLKWYVPEWLAAGVTVGLLVGSCLAAGISLIFPYSLSIPAAIGILCGLGYIFRKAEKGYLSLEKIWLAWLWLSTVTTSLLFYLLWTHVLFPTESGWNSVGPTWGDIALHMTLISHFAAQTRLGLDLPIFAGAHLSYPFLIDFLSSLLYRTGFSMRWSILLPSMLLMGAFIQLFFFLAYRLFHSRVTAMLAPILFLASGSAMSVWNFFHDWIQVGGSFLSFATLHTSNYTYVPTDNLQVYNVVASGLLPQRSILFGVSVFCLVVLFLLEARRNPQQGGLLRLAAGGITGLMPFAHTHTFLVLCVVLLFDAVSQAVEHRRIPRGALAALGLALVLAAPQGIWQMTSSFHGGFSYFHLGWFWQPSQENLLSFWLRNIGIVLPVILLAPFLPAIFRKRFWFVLAATSLALFILVNTVILQPNIFDNYKLLVYVFLIADLFLAYGLVWIARRWVWFLPVSMAIVGVLVAIGIIGLLPEFTTSYSILSNEDIAFATDFKKVVPADALVLTAQSDNDPVPTLTGRSILMGYPGWLWTYGIDYTQVNHDEAAMYASGPSAAALLKQYGIQYVVIGPQEQAEWGTDSSLFSSSYPKVLDEYGYQVFKIQAPSQAGLVP